MFSVVGKPLFQTTALNLFKDVLSRCRECGKSQVRRLVCFNTCKTPLMHAQTFQNRGISLCYQRNCWPFCIISGENYLIQFSKGHKRNTSSYVSPSGISFHFDTHKLVKALQTNGFTLEQAESLSSLFTEIISTSLENVTSNTVSKIEKEQLEMRFRSYVDSLRNDMIMLEKSEFARIKEENAELRTKVKSLESLLRDEVDKLKGGFALDFSLEKSRVKEEAAVQDQKIKDTHNRIETEVAKLGTQMEAQKLDLIKYLVGSLVSCVTLALAVWRFAKS